MGVGCCHLLAKWAQQENKCTKDDAFQRKDIGSYIVPSRNISEGRELLHDLLLGPTRPGAGMLCSRIGILCSRCMLRRLLSRLARQHHSTCGYQAQYQAQQEQPPSLHDNCCRLPQPELEKNTHTKHSSCNDPSSNPPKKHKPTLWFAKPLAFYKTQNLPLQNRLLHRCIITTLIKHQPKNTPQENWIRKSCLEFNPRS